MTSNESRELDPINFSAIQQRNNEGWLRDLALLEGSIGFTGTVVSVLASEYMANVLMQAPRKAHAP